MFWVTGQDKQLFAVKVLQGPPLVLPLEGYREGGSMFKFVWGVVTLISLLVVLVLVIRGDVSLMRISFAGPRLMLQLSRVH